MTKPQIIDKTMSFTAANIWGTVLGVLVFAIVLPIHQLIWQQSASKFLNTLHVDGLILVLFIIALFISISIHELLHGVGYVLGGANWSQIKFGITKFTPYAHCQIPLVVSDYRLAVALPGVLLGIAPTLGGLFAGSMPILLYGLFMTSAASGDALILWLLRDAPTEAKVLDHASKIGCQLHLE